MTTSLTDAESRVCGRCRRPIDKHAPDGLCMACLVESALEMDSSEPAFSRSTDVPDMGPSAGAAPAFFGDFELIEEVGRGGMGVVWTARQRGLGRIVALKLLSAGPFSTPEFRERFRREAATASRLQHPGIVTVFEAGELDGHAWLAMEFVPGRTLAELVRAQPIHPREAAKLVQSVATAIQHAHERGVLHRDLKPSNILVAPDGQARVTDFGLACDLDADSELTRTGQSLGSPAYCAPEQIRSGARLETDPSHTPLGATKTTPGVGTDVYGLGAVLYHLLTQRPPFGGTSLGETLLAVEQEEPIAPQTLNRGIPTDLEIICLKCLEKEPARRYQTAQELADELDRFLKDEPIHARPVSRAERAWRWCRRKPALAGALAAAVLFLIAGLAGVLWQWRAAQSHATAATLAATRAEANALTARRAQYASDMNLAHQAVQDGDFFRARKLLERYRRQESGDRSQEPETRSEKLEGARSVGQSILTPDSRLLTSTTSPDLRGWEWQYLHEQARAEEEFTLGDHTNGVTALGILPDGHTVWSAGWDNAVRLWDLRTRREIASLPHPHAFYHAAASPDGRWLVTAPWGENALRVWELSTRQEVAVLTTNFWLGPNIAFSPDGKLLAFQTLIGHDGFHVWDFETRQELAFLESNPRNNISPVGMAFSPDSRTFAYAAGHNGDVLLWDVATRTRTHTLSGHDSRVMGLAFSPDGATLASGDIGGVMKLWDVASRRERGAYTNQGAVVRLAFSPDGTRLASGGWFQRLRLHDARDGSLLRTFQGHVDSIHGLAFTPDGATILSGSGDGSVRAWSVAAATKPPASVAFGEPLPVWDGYGPAAFLSVNGRHALTVFTNQDFVIWDALALRPSQRFPAPLTNLSSAAISSDGRLIAFADWHGQVTLWDRSSGVRWTHQLSNERAYRLTFSVDDSQLAWLQIRKDRPEALLVCATDARGEPVMTQEIPDFVTALSFSRDGSALVVGLYDGDAALWTIRGEPATAIRFSGHRFQIGAMALSPDQRWLVTGSHDGIRHWDAASGQVTRHLRPRPAFFRRAAFSPDGRRIAVAGGDGQITIFDAETFDELATLKASTTPQGLAFAPDGGSLVTINAQELRVWRAKADAVVSRPSDSETKGTIP